MCNDNVSCNGNVAWQVAEGAIKVCTGAMLYNDPENITLTTLKRIFTEMAGLFPDQVFSMGGDEPYIIGNCTLESVVAMEQELARCVNRDHRHKKAYRPLSLAFAWLSLRLSRACLGGNHRNVIRDSVPCCGV